MKFPQVKNCCFCISLRTGALILGWMGTLIGGLAIFSTAISLKEFEEIAANPDKLLENTNYQNSNEPINSYEAGKAKESLQLKLDTQPS